MLLAGDAGIGKTRTTEEFLARFGNREAVAPWSSCYDGDGAPAFWPWRQVIRQVVQGLDPMRLEDLMQAGSADIAQILPEIRRLLPPLPEPVALEPELVRFRLFNSVTEFLLNLSRHRPDGPLTIVFDDLQYADLSSLLLLVYFAGEVREAPVLVVGTYRDREIGRQHPLAGVLARLARLGNCQTLRLGGLEEPSVAEYLEAALGREPTPLMVHELTQRSGGNPLFLTELVKLRASSDWPEAGHTLSALGVPSTIRSIIGQRLNRLSGPCQHLLSLASVLGHDFSVAVLERISALAQDKLLELLAEAEADDIVSVSPEHPGRYSFSHGLMRETLHDEVPHGRRLLLHREIAEALESVDTGSREIHLSDLSYHFFEARPIADLHKVVGYAREAGDRALTMLAYDEAAEQYQRAADALEESKTYDETTLDVLVALASALAHAGNPTRAQEVADRAARLARRLNMPEKLAQAALSFETAFGVLGAGNLFVIALLEEALTALGNASGSLRARFMARLAIELSWSNFPQRADSLSQEALKAARETGDVAAIVGALRARHISLQGPGDVQERLRLSAELVSLAEAHGHWAHAAWGRYYRSIDQLEKGDLVSLDVELLRYARLAEDLREPHHRWLATYSQATRALLAGDFETSERLSQTAFRLGQRLSNPNVADVYAGQVFALRIQQERPEELLTTVQSFAQRAGALPVWLSARAFLLVQLGEKAAQAEFGRLAVRDFENLPADLTWPATLAFLSEVCVELQDANRGAKLYELLRPLKGHNVVLATALCLGSASRYLGRLAALLGRFEDAVLHLEDALKHHWEMPAPIWLARTQYDLAETLLRYGAPEHRQRAHDYLRQANETAAAFGLTKLAERILTRFEQPQEGNLKGAPGHAPMAGEEPDQRRLLAPLTKREREIAALVAQGLQNREIATELYLSVRTVDAHVEHIFHKLSIHSRAQLAGWFVEQALHGR